MDLVDQRVDDAVERVQDARDGVPRWLARSGQLRAGGAAPRELYGRESSLIAPHRRRRLLGSIIRRSLRFWPVIESHCLRWRLWPAARTAARCAAGRGGCRRRLACGDLLQVAEAAAVGRVGAVPAKMEVLRGPFARAAHAGAARRRVDDLQSPEERGARSGRRLHPRRRRPEARSRRFCDDVTFKTYCLKCVPG